MSSSTVSQSICLTEDYVRQLEKHLEDREHRIHDLKITLAQKDEIMLATSEKLVAAERKRVELETSLLDLATDKGEDDEDTIDGNEDTFISSNCRAAKLDQENNELRYRVSHINSTIAEFYHNFNETIASENLSEESKNKLSETAEKIGTLIYTPMKKLSTVCKENSSSTSDSGNEDFSSYNSENVQLKVKMELEHERRLRTQQALDDAERRFFAIKRECDSKEKEYEDTDRKLTEMKQKHEAKMKLAKEENLRLESLLKSKESEIMASEVHAKGLVLRAGEFEEMFNGQLEIVKNLQDDLSKAYNDKKVLIKEMEALNEMFNTMEHKYVDQALKEYKYQEVDLNTDASEHAPQKDEGKNEKIVVNEVLTKDAELGNNNVIEDSCFKEVKTKNGTRMVLSVSKTFIKLRDLILEKKLLQDQVEKMKAVNSHLCNRVDVHEEKLFSITDELNKTWGYVSKIKLQHQELHTSEEVLRAELTEKRQLLAKLREELEFSRESWKIVKQKTADSERQWRELRDEFAARRRMFPSASSESGYSDQDGQLEEEENIDLDINDVKTTNSPVNISECVAEVKATLQNIPSIEITFSDDHEDNSENSSSLDTERGDPKNETEILYQNSQQELEPINETEEACIPLFIPSMEYMAQVPPDMLPPLFPSDLCQEEHNRDLNCRAMVGNYQELYQKLIASTARSAAIANRLAELHRNMNKSEGVDEGEEDDSSCIEPRTDDESVVEQDFESELVSEIDTPIENELESGVDLHLANNSSPTHSHTDDEDSDLELEDLGLTQEAIETALASSRFADEELSTTTSLSSSTRTSATSSPVPDSEEETTGGLSDFATYLTTPMRSPLVAPGGSTNPLATFTIPPAPPAPTFSLLPPPASVTVRPTFNYANVDSLDDSSDDDSENDDPTGASENATAVTRFLIKHLPKQLSKLRNDKAELEEKIQDLEATVSNQSQAMLEMERRVEIYKKEAETSRKWNSSLSLNLGKSNSEATKEAQTIHEHQEETAANNDSPTAPTSEETPKFHNEDITTPSTTDEQDGEIKIKEDEENGNNKDA